MLATFGYNMHRLFWGFCAAVFASVLDHMTAATPTVAAPETIAGKVYRDSSALSVVHESTIVFEDEERFTYLIENYADHTVLDGRPRIRSPRLNGRYRYIRQNLPASSVTPTNIESTIELDFDDGTKFSWSLLFGTATTGIVPLTFARFYLTDVSSWKATNSSNVSVRGTVSAGRPVIVGFSVGGDREILIRAVGPSLRSFGVSAAWADPNFRLYFGGKSGTRFMDAHYGDWDSPFDPPPVGNLLPANAGPGLGKVFSYVGAFPLQEGSKDAADVVRLPAGEYTVVCSTGSAADPGGEVLVEIYFLP